MNKNNVNEGRVCLGTAVLIVINILICVFLIKIFSFIGWFGFEYGWLKNPRCWGCIVGMIVIIFLAVVYEKFVHFNTCKLYTEPTPASTVLHMICIILNIIAVIVIIVQLCRIFHWGGFSTGLLLAFVPACRILLVSGIFDIIAYILGKPDKDDHNS